MHDPTASSDDSGLTRLHSETLNDTDGILTAPNSPCGHSELHKSWANRLQRAMTKLEYGDDRRAMQALAELKNEIRGTQ